ncbi:MAG: alpha-glucosidase [Clostridia bacterium]|nr:alpha-glucosidase [Clostridia bacterium]
MKKTQWYKDAVCYQIWPRSFCDGNGDGIGDLEGVLSKLDYLQDLGINCIWFSPLYCSPNADMGYDISDYRNISPDHGDNELFKKVLDEAHKRGIKVIMDLVVNHTSDEHEWFVKGIDKNSKYHDYYHWRDGKGNKNPNNWSSLFEGKAWEYNKENGQYYLHLFSKKQPDLKMENPEVRKEVKEIMKYWLDMGVDGFREDVITFTSKRDGLPNGFPIPQACGMEHYKDGPRIHEFLSEFREVLDDYDCFVVGEAPLMTPKNALKYIEEKPGQELDMMFHFQHMEADCIFMDCLNKPFSLKQLKKVFSNWQESLYGKAWNALYMENHDHPRIINRYGSVEYREESAKSIANSYMLQCGTPFVYQGQELGMINIDLPNVEDYQDIFAVNNAKTLKLFGFSDAKIEERLKTSSRGNARTPVQWDDTDNAGFTTGTPWMPVNPSYKDGINAKAEIADPNSVYNHYKALIKFRKENPIAVYGKYKEYCKSSKELYVYERTYEGKKMLVICSYSDKAADFKAPAGYDLSKGKAILCNYETNPVSANGFTTRPYETRVYVFD